VQLPELAHVLGVGAARGTLEDGGQLLNRRVGQEDAEPLAELALADLGVAVAVGAERRVRVVHVQRS
jgi:hypothetical protein